MAAEIEELVILDPESGLSIFSDSNIRYAIPLYQRAYSWSDIEIEQLIDDINDAEEGSDRYYIGSLIVFERGNCYEVIDGQQRLTTLMLLLAYLRDSAKDMGIVLQNTLSYDCRQRATKTFSRLVDGKNVPVEECDKALLDGYAVIENKFKAIDVDVFVERLSKVRIFRIPVPEETDLNRYFEIMNTRGEQLEQHDVLKAQLMSSINGNEGKAEFARIWEACSDMSGYVQMHFDVETRERFFGGEVVEENLGRFSVDFVLCLLRYRYLFDKHIIKREYANEASDGEWSLKELRASGRGRNKKVYYLNTRIALKGERGTTSDVRNKKSLQSVLQREGYCPDSCANASRRPPAVGMIAHPAAYRSYPGFIRDSALAPGSNPSRRGLYRLV